MSGDFEGACDLLGDQNPMNFGMLGRLPYKSTNNNCNKTSLLLGFNWNIRRIAQALRITAKTLTKHYFREIRSG